MKDNNRLGSAADRLLNGFDKKKASKPAAATADKKRTTIYLDPDVVGELDIIARCKGIARTELIESMIHIEVKNQENQRIIDEFKSLTQRISDAENQ